MLKFLGIGSAFNNEMGNTSAYIKENGTLVLIDCGETVFSRIKEMELLIDVERVYILITHNHSDHIGSLGTLIAYLNAYKSIVPNLVLATDEGAVSQEKNLVELLRLCGITEDKFELTYADMLEGVLTDLKKIELIPVNHSQNLQSYAIEFYFNNFTIYYTGDHNDLKYIKSVANKIKKDDLLYTDCTNMDYKNRPHILLSELEEIFNESKRQNVYCMHFDSYGCYSEARQLGFKTASKELSKVEILKHLVTRK